MKEENCNSMESKGQLKVASAVVIAVAGALFSLVLNYLFLFLELLNLLFHHYQLLWHHIKCFQIRHISELGLILLL